jgi:Protein of unknown function (DUF2829)
MDYWTAGSMVVKHKSKAYRMEWGKAGATFIYLDDRKPGEPRIKIDLGEKSIAYHRRMNFYPTQDDMLATDWELC